MQITLDTPNPSDLVADDEPQGHQAIPHCVAAANGSWCDLSSEDEDLDEEFDEEDFDDDFDDDFEEEEDDGYGDFDDTIDPFANKDADGEKEEDEEDVEFEDE